MTIDVAAVKSLQAEWTPGAVPLDVGRLSLRTIEVLPTVYQARAEGRESKRGLVDKSHIAKLASLLKDPQKDLDPITLLRVGKRSIVIDGHHRLEAYRSQKRKDIPVQWFAGSPQEALIESGLENAKSRLPMTAGDRSERAWELVCADLHSISRIVSGSGISTRQVSNMRKVRKNYLAEGQTPPASWGSVLREIWDKTDEEYEPLRGQEIIKKWIKDLNAAIGPSGTFKTAGKLSLLADALIGWGPKAMAQVYARLFYEYGASDELLARLEIERDELIEEIRDMKGQVDSLKSERESLSPF